MDLNWIVFPAPSVKMKQLENCPFIYIPRQKTKTTQSCMTFRTRKEDEGIPCLFFPYSEKGSFSDKILIFFHGNAEDIS